ncbi:MAG: ArsA family ATPase [Myxococcota bacterium]
MSVAALLERRLVLVTGKGGVGKSTCALALALVACRSGKRILLVELSARPVSSDFLSAPVPGHLPSRPLAGRFPSLWTCHLDAQLSLQEYLVEHIRIPRLVKLATENRVLARLWHVTPSVNETALLNTIYQLERAQLDDGRPRFDIIIVDMPATGHALTLLGVPRGMASMVRIGALAERAHAMDVLLHDRAKVALCIVTLPEELPVNESIELAAKMHDKLDMDPSHVVINGVLSDPLDVEERELFDRISGAVESGPGRLLIDAATQNADRRRIQAQRIAELKARIRAEFIEVALLARRGFGLVDAVADALLAPA